MEERPAAGRGGRGLTMAAPSSSATFEVRPAGPADIPVIWRIYNQGVEDRLATFAAHMRPLSEIERWFQMPCFHAFVAESFRQPVGWGSLGRYRDGDAFSTIAEMSIYIDRAWRRHAVGQLLAGALIDAARASGLHKLVGYLLERNVSSRKLVEKLGFREVGVHRKHGPPGEDCPDVIVVEKLL